jgi:hypothetical protein
MSTSSGTRWMDVVGRGRNRNITYRSAKRSSSRSSGSVIAISVVKELEAG